MSLYEGIAHTDDAIVCDLRSDTVTRPDEPMRAAMAAAEVGDDVYGEDPTVTRLEGTLAEMLGKEAAVLFPTGTQSNLAAVLAHCGRGDEIVIGDGYHVYRDEAAGASVLGGVAFDPVPVEADGGLCPDAVRAAIKEDDPHYAMTRLLCVENTVGGRAVPLARMTAAVEAARAGGLAVHLDGARFFNAVAALGCEAAALAGVADTVSVCLSKGLGCPVGSVLVGDARSIARARRNRKLLGGAMRQSGVLAAAGLHALTANLPRLAEDHARAARLAAGLYALDAGEVRHETNMVFLTPRTIPPADLSTRLAEQGVAIGGQSPAIRLVVHRDVDDAALDHALSAFAVALDEVA